MSNYIIKQKYKWSPSDDKEIVFNLRALTAAERDECSKIKVEGDKVYTQFDRIKLAEYAIESIEGLNIVIDDEVIPIKTGADFNKYDFEAIRYGVLAMIISNTARKDLKKS